MKNYLKKTMLTFLTTSLIVTGAAACGNSSGKQPEQQEKPVATKEAESSNEPIKLRILWWGSQARHDATLKALDLYTAQNPHVTFEPEFTGWDGYWDKLATQSAAKNAPDIIQMDASYLADYSSRKQLADLSNINTSDMDEALLNSGKYNDELFAIPLGNNAKGLAYNKEAVEKLGITLPANGWTWNEYFAFGEEAKSKLGSNQYALQDFSSSYQAYVAYQLSKGKGQVFVDEHSIHIDKDTFVEFQTKYDELRKAGVVPQGEVSVTDVELDPNADVLVNGMVLVRELHAAQSNALDGLKPGVFDMVTTPSDAEAGGWLKPSMFWSVSAGSKHIEESKKFIDWFINNEEVGEIVGTTRGMPVSKTVMGKLSPSFSDADKMGQALIEHTAPVAQQYVPEPQGWTSFVQKDYKTVCEKIMFGISTPEQAYDELMKLAEDYK